MISKHEPRIVTAVPHVITVIPPACEPVDYTDYLIYGRKSTNADPIALQNKAIAGRRMAERRTGINLVTRVVDQFVDRPKELLYLDGRPIRLVQGVYVTDNSGVETIIDPSVYWVSQYQYPTRIILREDQVWPSPCRQFEGIRVRCISGLITPFTIGNDNQTLTAVNHTYANGDAIQVSVRGGTLPSELNLESTYYAINVVSLTSLKLSLTAGGAAISFGSQGTPRAGATALKLFLGQVPDPIIRAILLIATADLLDLEEDEEMPGTALALLNSQTPPQV